MAQFPNLYPIMVFDLHPKVRTFLDELNKIGQIDLDEAGYPYLIRVDKQGGNFSIKISRNNRLENIILNPRKKADPLISWDLNDGFQRHGGKQVIMLEPDNAKTGPRKERQKRTAESFRRVVDQILME